MNDNLQSELIFSYISQWAIEYLKNSKWMPWITAESGKVNKIVAAFLAAAYAAGMTFTLTLVGAGHYTLDATGITLANLTHFLGHGVRVYAMQKGFYKMYSLPSTNGGTKA